MHGPLSPDLLRKMHAYWRAANYLSVGQIYLQDNPLLDVPLTLKHVKTRLLGHWGTTPGLNLLYVHLNRLIKENDLDMINVIGPGHGWSRPGGAELSRRLLYRALPGDRAQPHGDAAAVPAVFLAQWNPEPCRAGDAGLHPRGWRARIRAAACLWRGLRQPEPDRGLRHRATARRRPARWPPAGIRTSFSIRRGTARCCRSCI